MADVEISYKGSEIATMSSSGVKTLLTGDTFCEGDIIVEYTKPVPAAGSATTPSTAITANPTLSVSSSGLISASVSKSQSITPPVVAGYVSSGTAGTVTVSGSNTFQLSTYNGAHHAQVADRTVTITLTNPVHDDMMLGGGIYECQSEGVVGTQIDTFLTATDVKTVNVSGSAWGLCLRLYGPYVEPGTITCTGGVSCDDAFGGSTMEAWVEVTGDGTITIDGIDYDD